MEPVHCEAAGFVLVQASVAAQVQEPFLVQVQAPGVEAHFFGTVVPAEVQAVAQCSDAVVALACSHPIRTDWHRSLLAVLLARQFG